MKDKKEQKLDQVIKNYLFNTNTPKNDSLLKAKMILKAKKINNTHKKPTTKIKIAISSTFAVPILACLSLILVITNYNGNSLSLSNTQEYGDFHLLDRNLNLNDYHPLIPFIEEENLIEFEKFTHKKENFSKPTSSINSFFFIKYRFNVDNFNLHSTLLIEGENVNLTDLENFESLNNHANFLNKTFYYEYDDIYKSCFAYFTHNKIQYNLILEYNEKDAVTNHLNYISTTL